MKSLMSAALIFFLLSTSTVKAQGLDCDWFASIYKLVAQAKVDGLSKSEVYDALSKNQKSKNVRDTFLDIVNQVYIPDEAKRHFTPEQFGSMAFGYCLAKNPPKAGK